MFFIDNVLAESEIISSQTYDQKSSLKSYKHATKIDIILGHRIFL